MQTIIQKLEKPPKKYAPTFFWSWNDHLEEQELLQQLDEMEKHGIGAFFIHARPGLITDYMSDEWIRLVRVVVDACKNREIKPWLYDEHGWPSGIGGGKVTALGSEYQEKCLKIAEMPYEEAVGLENLLGIYTICQGRCEMIHDRPADGETVVAVYYILAEDYVDLLSEKVVKAFIDASYEAYKTALGEYFGTVIPGIFTDEPQFNSLDRPWSLDLPKAYREKYQEDIFPLLPGLFYDIEDAELFRYRFYSTVNELLTNNYFRQIGLWCRENGLKFTGHNMAEDCLFDSMLSNAGVMASYEYMDMPGTDWIGRTIRETTTPRQCSSVAAQLGKNRVLTEQFASCNWDVPFEELKWIADWNYVNGVNFFCQHLAAYSLRGLRKRDCPASLFKHNVWWEKYPVLADYLTRVSALLSDNEEVCDLAVLHPMKSAYLCFKRVNDGEILRLDNEFLCVLDYLSHLHIPYHLADENIIKRHGRVSDGLFHIGQRAYKAIALPRMHTLEKNTYELLLEFANSGGTIFFFGDFPDRLNGVPADLSKLERLATDCTQIPSYQNLLDCIHQKNADGCVTPSNIGFDEKLRTISNGVFTVQYRNFWEKTTQGILPRTSLDMPEARYIEIDKQTEAFLHNLDLVGISRTDVESDNGQISNIHVFHTFHDGTEVYFFANHSKYDTYHAQIALNTTELYSGYDPVENRSFPLQGVRLDDRFHFEYTFAPMESLILLRIEPPAEAADKEKNVIELDNEFAITDYGFNALTIDYCRYHTSENEAWSEATPVWDVHYRMLKAKKSTVLTMSFGFEIHPDFHFGNPLQIGMEDVEECEEIRINGKSIKDRFTGGVIDHSIQTADISDLAVHGMNEIIIRKPYRFDERAYLTLFDRSHMAAMDKITLPGETDSVYIFGRFAVYSKTPIENAERDGAFTDGPFYIDNENLTLHGLDIIRQGYLFYNQAICVEQKIQIDQKPDSCLLRLGRLRAVCAEVSVNGSFVSTQAFRPFEVDISPFIKDGENTVTLKLFTSNRNLFGNFHYKQGQVHWSNWYKQIDPKEWLFCDNDQSWYTDRYCFYRNGMETAAETVQLPEKR